METGSGAAVSVVSRRRHGCGSGVPVAKRVTRRGGDGGPGSTPEEVRLGG